MSPSTTDPAGPSVSYQSDEKILATVFTQQPTRPALLLLFQQAEQLIRLHKCPRWMLDLYPLPKGISATSRRMLLASLADLGGRHLGLQVALVTPRPNEAHQWLDGLPLNFGAWAFDLASFPTEPEAKKWLHTIPRAYIRA